MKKVSIILLLIFGGILSTQAQDKMMKDNMVNAEVAVISLSQTPGEFTQKELTIKPGTYVFEIENKQAGTDVGFVLVPKGKDVSNPENHIKTAYVTQVVKEGKIEKSKATTLTKGEYVYFCPLNKTATDNLLIVE